MKHIRYTAGHKYRLVETYVEQTAVRPLVPACAECLRLDESGLLTIFAGFAWDGPSGPTVDTPSAMRGSLVHDALYQLIGAGLVDPALREAADQELLRICLEDGMPSFRAHTWYRAVRLAGGDHLTVPEVLVAPGPLEQSTHPVSGLSD